MKFYFHGLTNLEQALWDSEENQLNFKKKKPPTEPGSGQVTICSAVVTIQTLSGRQRDRHEKIASWSIF